MGHLIFSRHFHGVAFAFSLVAEHAFLSDLSSLLNFIVLQHGVSTGEK